MFINWFDIPFVDSLQKVSNIDQSYLLLSANLVPL